jgi:hypothetical protein
LQRLVARLEPDFVAPGEVLAQVVGRAGLQRTTVAHQGLDRIGTIGSGELLTLRLLTVDDGHGQFGFGEVLVNRQHLPRFLLGLLRGFVCRVTLLPQELGGAQEQPCHLLPADHVRPLVDEDRQVAPRLDPFGVHRTDDGFGGGPHHEPLFERFGTTLRHPSHLRSEAFHVLRFFHQQAFGNEQRKVGIDVAGGLEAPVERLLHQLPDGVSVRPDHHAPFHGRIVGQFGAADHVDVPAAEVL